MTKNSASDKNSHSSIDEVMRQRIAYSGHGSSLGTAGYIDPNDQSLNMDFLGRRGDTLSISPPQTGYGNIKIAAAWNNKVEADQSFLCKLFKRSKPVNIDLDLGILYELHDGHRGAIQAFGSTMGAYNEPPYLSLSGDERTGNAPGDDEFIHVNGKEWPKIKRLLIYVYIYNGPQDWSQIQPQIHIRVPDQKPVVVTLSSQHRGLGLCAISSIENVRNGLRITNHTEYFPGHAEMDRAFGFGIEWENGEKT